MKKGIAFITLVAFLSVSNIAYASNTHSIDLELSSSQYLSITDGGQTGLDVSTNITLECWLKPKTIGINHSLIMKWTEDANRSYYFQIDTANKLLFYISDNGENSGGTLTKSDNAVFSATGTWVHLSASFEAGTPGTVKLYVNNVSVDFGFVASLNNAESIFNSDSPVLIGAYDGGGGAGNFADGLVDEVRIWNDVRTPTEISDNYKKELVGDEAGLVGYWKLNNSLLDETSNDNDLTNNNSATFSTDVPFVGAVRRIIMVE